MPCGTSPPTSVISWSNRSLTLWCTRPETPRSSTPADSGQQTWSTSPVSRRPRTCSSNGSSPSPAQCGLTVVGESMFGASIYPESPAAREDWRADYAALRYEPLTIPVRVAERARGFLDAFGLVYGAFDLILNQNEYVFLECNAAGQFGWLSEECDLPIAAAIADEFIKE